MAKKKESLKAKLSQAESELKQLQKQVTSVKSGFKGEEAPLKGEAVTSRLTTSH